jgi:hypothetical protein
VIRRALAVLLALFGAGVAVGFAAAPAFATGGCTSSGWTDVGYAYELDLTCTAGAVVDFTADPTHDVEWSTNDGAPPSLACVTTAYNAIWTTDPPCSTWDGSTITRVGSPPPLSADAALTVYDLGPYGSDGYDTYNSTADYAQTSYDCSCYTVTSGGGGGGGGSSSSGQVSADDVQLVADASSTTKDTLIAIAGNVLPYAALFAALIYGWVMARRLFGSGL